MTGEKNWEYIIFNFNSVDSPFVSLNYYPCNPQNVRNVKLDRNEIINMAYKGKKFCSFGDSIVELISWQKYVWKYLQFSTHYCRGIGGSKVTSISPKTKKVDENGYYNADSLGIFILYNGNNQRKQSGNQQYPYYGVLKLLQIQFP